MSDFVDKGPVDDFVHRRFGREACPGDIASHVLVPASKEEARELTASWTHVNQVADHYGFLVLTGQYRGQTLSVCSTQPSGRPRWIYPGNDHQECCHVRERPELSPAFGRRVTRAADSL